MCRLGPHPAASSWDLITPICPSGRGEPIPTRTASSLPLTLSFSRKGREGRQNYPHARIRRVPLSPRGRGTGMRGPSRRNRPDSISGARQRFYSGDKVKQFGGDLGLPGLTSSPAAIVRAFSRRCRTPLPWPRSARRSRSQIDSTAASVKSANTYSATSFSKKGPRLQVVKRRLTRRSSGNGSGVERQKQTAFDCRRDRPGGSGRTSPRRGKSRRAQCGHRVLGKRLTVSGTPPSRVAIGLAQAAFRPRSSASAAPRLPSTKSRSWRLEHCFRRFNKPLIEAADKAVLGGT